MGDVIAFPVKKVAAVVEPQAASWWVGLVGASFYDAAKTRAFKSMRVASEYKSTTGDTAREYQAHRAAYGRSIQAARRACGFDVPMVNLLRS